MNETDLKLFRPTPGQQFSNCKIPKKCQKRLISGDQRYITKCEKIANCDELNGFDWLNSCSSCADDYAWKFNPQIQEPDFTECVQNMILDLDCLALETPNLCGLCKSGFEPDANGICQHNDIDNCEILQISADEMYLPVRARWFTRSLNIGITEVNYFAYYGVYKEGFGCFECNGLFSLATTERERCLPKEEDPKAVWNSGNVAIVDCSEYFYPAEGNF